MTNNLGPDRTSLADAAMWLVENGAFALGMVLMFSRTSELAMAFAPATILGFTGLEVYYGMAVGMLVEGALFVMKLMLGRARNLLDWMWNVVIVVAPFAVSAIAQVFDSFQVRNTLAQQSQLVQDAVTWGVPSIPSLIIFLFISKSVFSSMPEEITPKWMRRVRRLGETPVAHVSVQFPEIPRPPVVVLPRSVGGYVGRFIGRRQPDPMKAAPSKRAQIEETPQNSPAPSQPGFPGESE